MITNRIIGSKTDSRLKLPMDKQTLLDIIKAILSKLNPTFIINPENLLKYKDNVIKNVDLAEKYYLKKSLNGCTGWRKEYAKYNRKDV